MNNQNNATPFKAIQFKNNIAGTYFQRASLHYNNRDYVKAMEDLKAALNIEPQNTALKEVLNAVSQFANMNSYFTRQGIDIDSKDAQQILEKKQFSQKPLTESLNAKNLNDAESYNERGFAYSEKEEYDQAISDYTKAIAMDPNFWEAYLNRANAYFEKGNYDKAIKDLDIVINNDPYDDQTMEFLRTTKQVYVAANAGNVNKTKYDDQDAFDRGKEYFENEDYDNAIKGFTEAIRLDPSRIEAYFLRSMTYKMKGQYDLTIKDLNEFIKLVPNDYGAYFIRGNVYQMKGQYDLAIKDLTEAIRFKPDYAEAFSKRGGAYYDKGQYDLAIRDCTEAIRLDPSDVEPYCTRGAVYCLKKEYIKAIPDYSQAIQLYPQNPILYYNRAHAYYMNENSKKAIADCKTLLSIDPNNIDAKKLLFLAEETSKMDRLMGR